MNRAEFQKFFRYISCVTTDTNPSAERTQVYWDMLNDLSFEVAMTAARKVIATTESPFLPMPGVFRSAVDEKKLLTGKKDPHRYDHCYSK